MVDVDLDDDAGGCRDPLVHRVSDRRQGAGGVAPGEAWVALEPGLVDGLLVGAVVQEHIGVGQAADRGARRLSRWDIGFTAAVLAQRRAAVAADDADLDRQRGRIDRAGPEGGPRVGGEHVGAVAQVDP